MTLPDATKRPIGSITPQEKARGFVGITVHGGLLRSSECAVASASAAADGAVLGVGADVLLGMMRQSKVKRLATNL